MRKRCRAASSSTSLARQPTWYNCFLGKRLLWGQRIVSEQSRSCGVHQTSWSDGWPPLAQQNLCLLLLTHAVARYLKSGEFIWAPRAWSCHCHRASRVLGMMTQLNRDFQAAAWRFVGSSLLRQTAPEGQLGKGMKCEPEESVLCLGHFCQDNRDVHRAASPPHPVQNGKFSRQTSDTCRACG